MADHPDGPALVLGPLLRHVSERGATVWVETDRACKVEVLATSSPTFAVGGHHYGLVDLSGLEPGTSTPYEVRLDGRPVWPDPGSGLPPSVIRTLRPDARLRLAFGSCRVAAPHGEPWSSLRDDHPEGHGADALHAYGLRMAGADHADWPDALMLLGDQVYADDASPRTRERIAARRDTAEPPGEDIADFEEFTWLYQEAWSSPVVRWVLSTVPTAMIFDDHDMTDDWNISASWVAEQRRDPHWEAHVVGGLMAYWLYQHLGNLSAADRAGHELLAEVRAAGDGEEVLRRWATDADGGTGGPDGRRWSFSRDLGPARLVVIDVRNGRLLEPGDRWLVGHTEWDWVRDEAQRGGVDHVLLATSLPFLLPEGVHHLERWDEKLCDGAWGRPGRWLGEKIRRSVDLEHWAAFGRSFDAMADLVRSVAAGGAEAEGNDGDRAAPATVCVLSGDVHFSYVAPVDTDDASGRIYQLVSSPLRNAVQHAVRRAHRFSVSRGGSVVGRLLLRTVPVDEPALSWDVAAGPYFGNGISTLEIDGRDARVTFERALPGRDERPELSLVFAYDLDAGQLVAAPEDP
ncbi:alkaline phosphatase D family protein [soil metagenome]